MPDNVLAALALGGFGLIVLAIVIASLRDAAAMKRWPVVRGRVLSSKVEECKEIIKGHTSNSRGDRMTLFRPAVVYEYEVDRVVADVDRTAGGIAAHDLCGEVGNSAALAAREYFR